MSLPKQLLDPCVILAAAEVEEYQTVAFDGNRYSVPRPFAFQTVAVKAYVNRVVIVVQGQAVATHTRSMVDTDEILDPIHYLLNPGPQARALDHSPVFRDWKLPTCFIEFRATLEPYFTARWPGRGGSCESCNCWASIP